MKIEILYKTAMKEIPKSCKECNMHFCSLPLKKNKSDRELCKPFFIIRHKYCPLVIIGDVNG